MRKLIFSIAMTQVLALPFAAAEFPVFDNEEIIERLKGWFTPGDFDRTLACGQSAKYEATIVKAELKCDNHWCRTTRVPYETPTGKGQFSLHVDDCSTDLAHVYGDNGLIVPVTRADFEAGGGNYLLPFLRSIGVWVQPEGEIHLTWTWPTSVEFLDNGSVRRISAQIVEGEIRYAGSSQAGSFRVVLSDELIGPRQILLFQFDKDDVFLRARGLIGEVMP